MSINPARAKDFALRGAQLRQQVYGRRVTIKKRDGTLVKAGVHCTMGPVTHRERLQEGGFLPAVDTIIRIPVNMLTEDQLAWDDYTFHDERYPEKVFVALDPKDDPLNVEWVIGLKQETD